MADCTNQTARLCLRTAVAALAVVPLVLFMSVVSQATPTLPNDSLETAHVVLVDIEAWQNDCIAGALFRQDERQTLRRIEQAMAAGDIRSLFYTFSDQVEVMILGEGSMYSRAQASYVLRDFFRLHPPERFELDDATRARDSQIAMGQYWSRGEEQPMRVYVRLRVRDARWELKEMRIEVIPKR